MSGIAAYKNLITLPVKRLAANLERNLWIRDVKVGRHLLHTVNMVVEERSPLAMLDYNGACFLVDERGFIFTGTAADQLPELLRIYCGDLACTENRGDGEGQEDIGIRQDRGIDAPGFEDFIIAGKSI